MSDSDFHRKVSGPPPSDVAPADLWLRLQASPRPSKVVQFPRRGTGRVRIMCLSELEQGELLVEARRYVLDRLGAEERKGLAPRALREDPALRSMYADTTARMILAKAVVTVDPVSGANTPRPTYGRVFPNHEAMGRELSGDEVATLWTQYQLVQATHSPSLAGMTPAEEEDWIRVLAEGGSELPLAWLATSEQLAFTARLASEVYALRSTLASLSDDLRKPWAEKCPTFLSAITSVSWLPCTHTGSTWETRVPDDHKPPEPWMSEGPEWDGEDLQFVDRVRRSTATEPND